jgi:methionyl-tRNA formyltransferase
MNPLPPQLVWQPLDIVFIGCVMEGRRTLEGLLERGEHISAVFTFDPAKAATISGAARWDDITAEHGIPLHHVRSINDPEPLALIRALAPDLVFCVGWTQLLGTELLTIPRLGCLGFHASLLPHYRGRAPVNWAIINGETVTGNTLMVLDEGADTGDIVAQRAIAIDDDDTCGTVYDKVADTELAMLDEVMPLIHVGLMPRRGQDDARATVYGRRRPEDGRIDWARTTRQLHDWARALTHPYPGAFTTIAGVRTWVWRAHPATEPAPGARPGRWRLTGTPPELRAGTLDGELVIDVVQRDGEDACDGITFARRWLPAGGATAADAPGALEGGFEPAVGAPLLVGPLEGGRS